MGTVSQGRICESPLHVAMRKGLFQEAEKLVQKGANPAHKDAAGYSVIDYAIFDGQANQIPALLSSGQTDIKITAQESKEIQEILNSPIFAELRNMLSAFHEDKLQDKTSLQYKEYTNFLKENGNTRLGNASATLVHFVALFGNAEAVKIALETFPDMLKSKDLCGNTPLHYAAYNKDETAFVQLIKEGANLFTLNANGQTSLGLLVSRVQKEDPLAWDRRDLLMFISSWLPSTFEAIRKSGLLPEGLASLLMLQGLASTALSIASTASWLSVLLEQFNSNPKKFFFTLALLGTSWVPVLNLPVRSYIAYVFFSRAYQTLKDSWQHAYHRPIKATCLSAVRLSNAYESGKRLYQDFSVANFLIKVGNVFSEFVEGFEAYDANIKDKCGDETPEMFTFDDVDNQPVVNPNYPKFVECALNVTETTFNKTFERNPTLKDFFERAFKPCASELSNDCPKAQMEGGPEGFVNCFEAIWDHYITSYFDPTANRNQAASSCEDYQKPDNFDHMTLEERISAIKNPTCVQAALDMIGQSAVCSASPSKTCRDLAASVSPDKHSENKGYYQELTIKLNQACDVLKSAFKNQCS